MSFSYFSKPNPFCDFSKPSKNQFNPVNVPKCILSDLNYRAPEFCPKNYQNQNGSFNYEEFFNQFKA